MGKRLPQLYYIKMKLSYDLDLVQRNDAITLFYLSLVWRDSVGVGVPGRGLNQSVRVIF